MTTPSVPPFLSVVDEGAGPVLVLTIDPNGIYSCDGCPWSHVRLLDVPATPAAIRRLATVLQKWADRYEGVQ